MALTAKELIEIERTLAADGADMGPFVGPRRRFPQLSWGGCDASELSDQPFRQFSRLDLLDRPDIATCRLRPTQRDRLASCWPKGAVGGEH